VRARRGVSAERRRSPRVAPLVALLCSSATLLAAAHARAQTAPGPTPPTGDPPPMPAGAQPVVPPPATPAMPGAATAPVDRTQPPEDAKSTKETPRQPGVTEPASPSPAAVADADRPYSRYELETLQAALGQRGLELEPAPEGKLIESIDLVILDVLEERDPPQRIWPPLTGFLNWFHTTTRPHVIEREVLLSVGQPWNQTLVDETAKNLRGARQLSLVMCVPVKGRAPGSVRMLVITKDVWSLRLNSNYRFAGGRLQYLLLQPSEENLFGMHQTLNGQFLLEGETYSLGAGVRVPRMDGSRRALVLDANVILNREEGNVEGSFGSVAYGQPLYSTLAEWAWVGSLAWRREISRRYIDGVQAIYLAPSAPDVDPLPPEFRIPYRYQSDLFAASAGVTRSFGRDLKNDFELGWEVSRRVFFIDDDLSAYDAQAVDEFKDQIPVTDRRFNPYVGYAAYSTRLAHTLDYQTLGLQEDFYRGHEITVKLYPVLKALGSSRDLFGVQVGALYSLPILDGVAAAYAESITEMEVDRLADASIEAGVHLATPSFKVARLVVDARILDRYRNYLRKQTTLGGDKRLRGYATGAFFGDDALVANVELRSKPLEIATVQTGMALFYDVGDAFDGFDDLRVKQSVGVGLRVLFPQLERAVLRADWGFPLTRPVDGDVFQDPYADGFPGDIIITVRQAFGAPSVPSRGGIAD
jgi:hypothetical protein